MESEIIASSFLRKERLGIIQFPSPSRHHRPLILAINVAAEENAKLIHERVKEPLEIAYICIKTPDPGYIELGPANLN